MRYNAAMATASSVGLVLGTNLTLLLGTAFPPYLEGCMLTLVCVLILQVLIQAAWTLASILEGSLASIEAMISAQGLEAILKQLSQLSSGHCGTLPASPQTSVAVDALLTILVLALTQHQCASVRFYNEVNHSRHAIFSHTWSKLSMHAINLREAADASVGS